MYAFPILEKAFAINLKSALFSRPTSTAFSHCSIHFLYSFCSKYTAVKIINNYIQKISISINDVNLFNKITKYKSFLVFDEELKNTHYNSRTTINIDCNYFKYENKNMTSKTHKKYWFSKNYKTTKYNTNQQ